MSYRWEFSLAGVRYGDVPKLGGNGGLGRQLGLRRRVWLERDPHNTHDPSAIAVKARSSRAGKSLMLGFVPMETSPRVAPLLDRSATPIVGSVTGLHEDVGEGSTGANWEVTVTCLVPDDWQDAVRSPMKRRIEYYFYKGVSAPYVLLNCSDEQFREIRVSMAEHGIRYSGHGRSWHVDLPTPYVWYIHLEPRLESYEETVEGFFREVYGLESERERSEARRRQETKYRQALDALKKARDDARTFEELASHYDELYDRADCEAAEAKAVVEQMQNRLSAKEHRINYLQEELEHERRTRETGVTQEVGAALREVVGPELVPARSLDLVARLFPERLEILESARNGAKKADSFKHLSQLFQLLWLLATRYWQARINNVPDTEARHIFGESYAAMESETTQNNKAAWKRRTFRYRDGDLEMPQHLKIGRTFRVHFAWVAADHKIVIGHCGEHLPLV